MRDATGIALCGLVVGGALYAGLSYYAPLPDCKAIKVNAAVELKAAQTCGQIVDCSMAFEEVKQVVWAQYKADQCE